MEQGKSLRVAGRTEPQTFRLEPDAEARDRLAHELGIEAVRKLRFAGLLRPEGRGDWRLDAELGATVVQACVVTLAPVTTRIDEPVTRRYVARLPELEFEPGSEVEMPEDDTVEALSDSVDLEGVMTEALFLALPRYPRAAGVELGSAVFTEPGHEPLTDEGVRPFAGLKSLRDRMKG